MLTVLLALELCSLFLAAPLAAKGLPMARAVADVLVLVVFLVAVLLSVPGVKATGEPKFCPSTTNCTEPVGAAVEPEPVLVTVAVKLTDWP